MTGVEPLVAHRYGEFLLIVFIFVSVSIILGLFCSRLTWIAKDFFQLLEVQEPKFLLIFFSLLNL